MSQGKVDIELKTPIKVGGKDVMAISLREPKLKDHDIFDAFPVDPESANMTAGKMLEIAQLSAERLGELTPLEAGSISIQDGVAIFAAVSGFFGDLPEETGPTGPKE